MRRFNLLSGPTEPDPSDPEGYRTRMARFGPALGATMLGASLYELPPGQAISPYHYELGDEEWLVVLEGHATVRHPGGEDRLAPGDTVCFAPGAEGAHKVTNETAAPVRALMFSTRNVPSVAVFPDSDKVSLIAPDERDSIDVLRSSAVGYWEGEA